MKDLQGFGNLAGQLESCKVFSNLVGIIKQQDYGLFIRYINRRIWQKSHYQN